jgi:hypothetical protein
MRVSKAHRKCPGPRAGLFVLERPYCTFLWVDPKKTVAARHRVCWRCDEHTGTSFLNTNWPRTESFRNLVGTLEAFRCLPMCHTGGLPRRISMVVESEAYGPKPFLDSFGWPTMQTRIRGSAFVGTQVSGIAQTGIAGDSGSNRLQNDDPHWALLLHQTVKVHAAVIVGHIDLASVNHRRIKLVKQKRDGKALRVP